MAGKILIAEDEALIRLLLKRSFKCFQKMGVDVLVAGNGKEAFELAMNEMPNIMFLDIMMPEMNGFDVCRKIRENSALRNIYIIILTAKSEYLDKEEGFRAGANEYLTKPINPDDLVGRVKSVLDIKAL